MGALKEPLLQFLVVANTTNSERNRTLEDNTVLATVTVDIDTQLTLYGLVYICVKVETMIVMSECIYSIQFNAKTFMLS